MNVFMCVTCRTGYEVEEGVTYTLPEDSPHVGHRGKVIGGAESVEEAVRLGLYME